MRASSFARECTLSRAVFIATEFCKATDAVLFGGIFGIVFGGSLIGAVFGILLVFLDALLSLITFSASVLIFTIFLFSSSFAVHIISS